MHNLGYLYSTGQGVAKDPAQLWHRQGAEHGAELSQEIGYYYLRGENVPKDPATAAQWFQKAAGQGSVNAQFELGMLYYSGDTGVKRIMSRRRNG